MQQIQNRYDVFEPGDLTSLVCIDDPEVQKVVVDQLSALNYKIHTGLFTEDISLKLKAHDYNIVVVYETFNDWDAETNQVLAEAVRLESSHRRNQLLVLVGPNMATGDQMQAFGYSVDLVCSVADLPNLKTVLRRAVNSHKQFYSVYNDALREQAGV
jgi:hypothetical protein